MKNLGEFVKNIAQSLGAAEAKYEVQFIPLSRLWGFFLQENYPMSLVYDVIKQLYENYNIVVKIDNYSELELINYFRLFS